MKKIMSGDYSEDMWKAINEAKTKDDLKDALYFVCCRLQELESKYDNNCCFKLPVVKEKK